MCSLEFPDLEVDFHRAYADRGLVVIGLSAGGNGDADDVRDFVESAGVTFPVVMDDDGTYAAYTAESSISPYPVDIVTDADGRIVYLAREYEPDALRAAVEGVLP